MKKLKRILNLIYVFFVGFDYAMRFKTDPNSYYSWSGTPKQNKAYRLGIKSANSYKSYRQELFALVLIVFGAILLITM
jgi:hypothetical protein